MRLFSYLFFFSFQSVPHEKTITVAFLSNFFLKSGQNDHFVRIAKIFVECQSLSKVFGSTYDRNLGTKIKKTLTIAPEEQLGLRKQIGSWLVIVKDPSPIAHRCQKGHDTRSSEQFEIIHILSVFSSPLKQKCERNLRKKFGQLYLL